jgi:hypothetical protein
VVTVAATRQRVSRRVRRCHRRKSTECLGAARWRRSIGRLRRSCSQVHDRRTRNVLATRRTRAQLIVRLNDDELREVALKRAPTQLAPAGLQCAVTQLGDGDERHEDWSRADQGAIFRCSDAGAIGINECADDHRVDNDRGARRDAAHRSARTAFSLLHSSGVKPSIANSSALGRGRARRRASSGGTTTSTGSCGSSTTDTRSIVLPNHLVDAGT